MFSAIRRRMHVTPSTVIATLALVFAMSGGAYAAGKYLITSTKQIKPSVLKQLQGKAGAAGAQGGQGLKGETGAAGSAGGKGEKGEKGEKGTAGTNGTNGTTGFTETLPPEKTETGAWAISSTGAGEAMSSISFTIPLAGPLAVSHVHYVTKTEWVGHTAPAECPGSVAAPMAQAGYLCVYELAALEVTFERILQPTGVAEGAGTTGALLNFTTGSTPPIRAWGTWAVTEV